jgi:hypothetical protein
MCAVPEIKTQPRLSTWELLYALDTSIACVVS